jgi:hypothetical protein
VGGSTDAEPAEMGHLSAVTRSTHRDRSNSWATSSGTLTWSPSEYASPSWQTRHGASTFTLTVFSGMN